MCFTSHNAILLSIQICCFLILKKNLLIFFVKLFFALLCYCVPYFVPQSVVRFRFQFLITNFGSVFFKLLPLYLCHVCVSSVLILCLPLCRVFIKKRAEFNTLTSDLKFENLRNWCFLVLSICENSQRWSQEGQLWDLE